MNDPTPSRPPWEAAVLTLLTALSVVGVVLIGETAPEEPPVAQGGVGHLNLDVEPWVEVSLDGRPLGTTPLIAVPLPSGTHELRLVRSSHAIDRRHRVVIEADRTTAQQIDLR